MKRKTILYGAIGELPEDSFFVGLGPTIDCDLCNADGLNELKHLVRDSAEGYQHLDDSDLPVIPYLTELLHDGLLELHAIEKDDFIAVSAEDYEEMTAVTTSAEEKKQQRFAWSASQQLARTMSLRGRKVKHTHI